MICASICQSIVSGLHFFEVSCLKPNFIYRLLVFWSWFFYLSRFYCNYFCLQPPQWIAILFAKFSKGINSCLKNQRRSRSMYQNTMSFRWRFYILSSKTILKSISSFKMHMQKTGSQIASIFSPSWILCIPIMSARWSSMQTARDFQLKERRMRSKC